MQMNFELLGKEGKKTLNRIKIHKFKYTRELRERHSQYIDTFKFCFGSVYRSLLLAVSISLVNATKDDTK